MPLPVHPLEVARSLVENLQRSDLDAALRLYAPDAVLHADGEDRTGSELGAWLEASPCFGTEEQPDVRATGGIVVVSWEASPEVGVELRSRIENGLIREQWAATPTTQGRRTELEDVEVKVVPRGDVHDTDIDYVLDKVAAVLRRIADPVLYVRIKLGVAGTPARAEPALAQVLIDIDGDLIRAQTTSRTLREAVDQVQARLIDRVEHRAQRLEHLRTRGPGEPGVWRRGDMRTERPDFYDRPVQERELVRQKTFSVDELTPDEAAFDMEQLDHDFHLYRDLASGEDAVIERLDDGKYQLTLLNAVEVDPGPTAVELTISDRTPPRVTVTEARELLDQSAAPFVFFANSGSGRGNILYRRYDGHYGLITPA